MKIRFLLLCLCLLQTLAQAQGVVNVNNRGLVGPEWFPQQPTVREPNGDLLVGTNYVAQIVYGSNPQSLTNELGAAMPFRVSTTSFPGTWNSGTNSTRILSGFTEGQTVYLAVYVWDPAYFSGWRDLPLEGDISGRPTMIGRSGWFPYVVGNPKNPSSLSMTEFRGIQLIRLGWPGPPPATVGIEEGGELILSRVEYSWVVPTGAGNPTFEVDWIGSTFRIRSKPGILGSLGLYGLRSAPPLCVNGSYGHPADGHCTAPPRYQRVDFIVTPSSRRPFLDFALTNSRPSLTLRGLPPRSYRIEGSTNLTGWTRLGELSMGEDGNAPVPGAWLATNATQFVRFVPLPQ